MLPTSDSTPRRRRAPRAGCRLALWALLLPALAACTSDAPRPVDPALDLHHPDAVRRTLAVQDVVRRGDARRLPDLVELLEDPDDTVRLQAAAALRRLTGHDAGYRPYASAAERRAAVEAWRAWLAGRSGGAERGGP